MVLENKTYVPTLAIRASEMNGLGYLPGATKDRMTPCFLLAPWANANSLDKAIGRIESAYPNRHYFLDIDRDYQFTNLESEPQQQLAELLNPRNSFENWTKFLADHEWALPCIQSRGQDEAQIRRQIEAFQALERPFCMRIVRDRFPDNIDEIVSAVAAGGTADFAIILEGGWTRDPLTLSLWFVGIMANSLQAIDASVPTILSCTSFPKLFSSFDGGVSSVSFTNRELMDQVAKVSNRTSVVYGDWGSTRPREVGGFASRPIDRIDYPTSSTWSIARNKNDQWDFEDAANAILASGAWDGNLGVWGEEMIEQTAINEQLGINTPQKNVAARVNIHLHRQAFFDRGDLGGMNFDEDWED